MLTTVVGNTDLNINLDIFGEDRSSDTDFYYKNLLTKAGGVAINKIFDAELFEFKPVSKTVNYFIYFLNFKDMKFNNDIINNIEPEFKTYLSTATHILNGRPGEISMYDFKQSNNNILQKNEYQIDKSSLRLLQDKPFTVTNPVSELNKIQPLRSGLPLFYDTFTFPFSQKIDNWKNEQRKFSDKPFLYNSFLIMEIYDSPNSATQKRLGGIPVMVNDRYMYYEKSANKVKQLRPTFSLTEGVDGFGLYFLKQYNINKLYIKYSFWDGLSGVKIPLIPSTINNIGKKCIQSASNFDHNNEYLLFNLNYNTKTYKIYEYNVVNKVHNIEGYDFDLYQLYYDDYWAGKIVPNKRPIPLVESEEIIVDSNYKFNVSVNKNSINVIDNLDKKYVDKDQIVKYLRTFPTDNNYTQLNELILSKYYTPTMISIKKTLPATKKTLFINNANQEISANVHERLIDTIHIRNNSINDSVVIKSLSITDFSVDNNALDHYKYASGIHDSDPKNLVYGASYNVSNKLGGSQKTILCENFSGYSDMFNFVTHNLVASMYFQVDKHIAGAGFDIADSKNFGSYIQDNYFYYVDYNRHNDLNERIISKNDLNVMYGHSWIYNTGDPKRDSRYIRNIDPKKDYANVLKAYSNSDPVLVVLYYNNNTEVDNYLKGQITKNLADPEYIIKYLSKEVEFYRNPRPEKLNAHLRFQDEYKKFVGVFANSTTFNENINNTIYQENYGNMRDYLLALTATCNINKSSILSPGQGVDINLSLRMGEMYNYIIYDIHEPMIIKANLKAKLEDQHKNVKNITIPITYTLN